MLRSIFRLVLNASNDFIYDTTNALQKIFRFEDTRKFDLHGFKEEYYSKSPFNQIIKILNKSILN